MKQEEKRQQLEKEVNTLLASDDNALQKQQIAINILKEKTNLLNLNKSKSFSERFGSLITILVSGGTAILGLITAWTALNESAKQNERAYSFNLTDNIVRLVTTAQNDSSLENKILSLRLLAYYERDAIQFYMYLLDAYSKSLSEDFSVLKDLILNECLPEVKNKLDTTDHRRMQYFKTLVRSGLNNLALSESEKKNYDLPLITQYATAMVNLTGLDTNVISMFSQWNKLLEKSAKNNIADYDNFKLEICKYIEQLKGEKSCDSYLKNS